MNDGIIKNDGTSRFLAGSFPETYEELRRLAEQKKLQVDVLFNPLGWLTQPDFLNKANLLKDATAALYGLPSSAVPDEVLAWVGKYNLHWWRRRTKAGTKYVEKKENLAQYATLVFVGSTVLYAKSISLNADTGEINLISPTETTTNSASDVQNMESVLKNFAPCYTMIKDSPRVYYLPENPAIEYIAATTIVRADNISHVDESVCVKSVTASLTTVPAGDWEYVNSPNRNAYPDSGEQDGYEYQYLGVPFENSVTPPKIETGSYVGTGTYGSSNPNTVTLNNPFKLFWLYGSFYTNYSSARAATMFLTRDSVVVGEEFVFTETGTKKSVTISNVSDNIVSWYGSTADSQMNYSGYRYYYIAIG